VQARQGGKLADEDPRRAIQPLPLGRDEERSSNAGTTTSIAFSVMIRSSSPTNASVRSDADG